MNSNNSGIWLYELKDCTLCFDSHAEALESPWRTPNVALLVKLYALLTREQIKLMVSGKPDNGVTWSTQERALARVSDHDTSELFLSYSTIPLQSLSSATAGLEPELAIDTSNGVRCVDSLQKISVLDENGRWLTHGCRSPLSDYVFGL
jgi:hypothetical protein